MTKAYTGFEAIERMKTHWITTHEKGCAWRIDDGNLWMMAGELARHVNETVNFFFQNEFIDYVEQLKVGDWVHVTEDEVEQYVAKVVAIEGSTVEVDETIYIANAHRFIHFAKLRKATEEEIAEEERRRAFAAKGREMNEFKLGDIGEREDTLYKVVVQTEDNKFEGVIGCVAINEKDAPVKYFPVKSVELHFCVEDMVG
ncbi:hypothetical protein SAMN04488168_101479 [Bacillus sp. 491mf]|uniref:hypothetical protein n=1 Tax=Bacillus sp. 491mf TaxID=1761755 RepID=UPI0008E3ADF1|nr:hypothetical protein [Bacillus sp. 491mf]SFC02089.1 hypothetical protein SAMN04488168_101479 [Bacillus sp. 491mf]